MSEIANLIGGGPDNGAQLPVRRHGRFIEGISVLLAEGKSTSRHWAYERVGETSDYLWRGWVDELDVNEPDWREVTA